MIEFRAAGYIELWRGDEQISRHRVEREALESAAASGSGEYELRFPIVHVIVRIPITVPSTPELGTPVVVSSTALTVPLVRQSGGPVSLSQYVLERRAYGDAAFSEIASGLGIFDGDGYADTGLTAGVQYEYRSRATDSTDRSSEWSAPVFGTAAAASTINPPENVTATSVAGGIDLSWSAPSSGLSPTSYEIQRTYAADGAWSVKATQAGTTYSDTDVLEGQAKWYRIVSINGSNRSAESASVTAVGGAAGGGDYKKWNPGHYVKTQGDHSTTDQTGYWADVFNQAADSLDISELKGNYTQVAWGVINPTGSTFDPTRIDAFLNWHTANSRKALIEISWKNFRTNVGLTAPADVISAGNTIRTSSGWIAAIWRPAVMDRVIAAFEWFASQYDGHPALEIISMSESAPSLLQPFPADYSRSGLATQYKRLFEACSAAFAHTNVCTKLNSLAGEMAQLIETSYQAGLGHGTPDAHDGIANVLFRGETAGSPAETGVRDYRGLMANAQIASSPVINVDGKDYNGPASNVINWAQANSVTHLSWITTGSTTGATWSEVKTAIQADPLLASACPTVYGGTCQT